MCICHTPGGKKKKKQEMVINLGFLKDRDGHNLDYGKLFINKQI